jgi:integrase
VLEAQRGQVDEIEQRTGQTVSWVFPNPDGSKIRDFRHSWETACRDAKVAGRLFHDYRRTAVRNLEAGGVSRSASMKMTGHETATVFDRYAIADSSTLKEAGAKLTAYYERVARTAKTVTKQVQNRRL